MLSFSKKSFCFLNLPSTVNGDETQRFVVNVFPVCCLDRFRFELFDERCREKKFHDIFSFSAIYLSKLILLVFLFQ
jgi:hypothetical protein